MSGGRVVTFSAGQSQVTTEKTAPAADGVEVNEVYVTVKQVREEGGEALPVVGLAASNIVVSVTGGTGNVVTQATGVTDAGGAVTASYVSNSAGTKTISATVLGVAVTGSATVTQGGTIDPPDPGEPFYAQPTTVGNTRQSEGGFTWSTSDADVTEQVVPAGKSGYGLRFRFGPDAAGADSNAEQRFNMGRQLTHLWLEYDLYIPANFAHRNDSPNNNKFAMFWRTTYSDVANGTWRIGHEYSRAGATSSNIRAMSSRWDLNSWTSSGYNPTGQDDLLISSSGPLTIGAWNQVRIELAAASAYGASDGIHRVWINGDLFLETTTGKFWNFDTGTDPADCWLQNGYFLGYANSGFAEQTDFYVYGAKFYDADPGWL